MRFFLFLAAAGLLLLSCSRKSPASNNTPYYPQPPQDKGWKFDSVPAWSEEFDYSGKPDTAKWGYDLGGSGWGNNELEYYTDALENAGVAGGKLTITAKKETMGGRNYTSARLLSKNKGSFLYGRMEVSAKLPSGKGTWPAIWMLPTDWVYGNWPNSGEFDIMEQVGYDPGVIHVSAHTQAYNFKIGNQKTATITVPSAMTDFHLYRVDWTPYAIRGYVDNKLILSYVNDGSGAAVWPFDQKFHLMLNIAIGGDWGGIQGVDDSIFPATMEIDYVRIYRMLDL